MNLSPTFRSERDFVIHIILEVPTSLLAAILITATPFLTVVVIATLTLTRVIDHVTLTLVLTATGVDRLARVTAATALVLIASTTRRCGTLTLIAAAFCIRGLDRERHEGSVVATHALPAGYFQLHRFAAFCLAHNVVQHFTADGEVTAVIRGLRSLLLTNEKRTAVFVFGHGLLSFQLVLTRLERLRELFDLSLRQQIEVSPLQCMIIRIQFFVILDAVNFGESLVHLILRIIHRNIEFVLVDLRRECFIDRLAELTFLWREVIMLAPLLGSGLFGRCLLGRKNGHLTGTGELAAMQTEGSQRTPDGV